MRWWKLLYSVPTYMYMYVYNVHVCGHGTALFGMKSTIGTGALTRAELECETSNVHVAWAILSLRLDPAGLRGRVLEVLTLFTNAHRHVCMYV